MSHLLRISDLHVSVEDLPILNGVNLEIRTGEVHALMGPNGSGKSTLAYALAGHPKYQITRGTVDIDGTDLLALDPNERARLGLFLAFQYPVTIPGVKVADFLRHAASNVRNPNRKEGEGLIPMRDFRRELRSRMEELGIEPEFARRYLNDGFSGGEKKRMEILQMAMLAPRFAILDETDSGLDSDAVRVVSEGLARLAGPEHGRVDHHAPRAAVGIQQAATDTRDSGRQNCGNRGRRAGTSIAFQWLRGGPRAAPRRRRTREAGPGKIDRQNGRRPTAAKRPTPPPNRSWPRPD